MKPPPLALYLVSLDYPLPSTTYSLVLYSDVNLALSHVTAASTSSFVQPG
jgi:hypothetical protein